jgi:hypothetical protein
MSLYAIRFGEARGISRFIESATKLATWEMEVHSAPVLYSLECVEGEFLELLHLSRFLGSCLNPSNPSHWTR